MADSDLGDVLWRAACLDDAVREGFLIGPKRRLTDKGVRKLQELLSGGWEPGVGERIGDQEQAKRIREWLPKYLADMDAFNNPIEVDPAKMAMNEHKLQQIWEGDDGEA